MKFEGLSTLRPDLAFIAHWVKEGSHVLDVVEKICDRVLIVHQGRLIANDTPEVLKASTGQATLEDVFRSLTHSADVDPGVARIVDALRL